MMPSTDSMMPKMPTAPAPAPTFGLTPTGKKPSAKSNQTTYLGTEATPSLAQSGWKTLLGQ